MDQNPILMKKYCLAILLLSVVSTLSAQSPVEQVMKKYFRTHPFNMKFSSFIQSLQKDPLFTIERFNRRTDTTFFYLTGAYKEFNPFRYKPTEIRLIIAEEEFVLQDSLKTLDTVINLQLMGITGSNEQESGKVIDEFRRFHNTLSSYFSGFNYDKFESDNIIHAELRNYFIEPFSVAPVSTAWGRMPDTKEFTFTITVRFKVKQNIADLITAVFF
jgi:hypothetical protein